jgi:hypothetical protein
MAAAGGMGGRRGIPLQDRVRADTPPEQPQPAPAATAPAATRPAGRRHCWVRLVDHDTEVEGLVYQWTRDGDGWAALVIYVLDQPTGPTAVQQWLSARRLRPIGNI